MKLREKLGIEIKENGTFIPDCTCICGIACLYKKDIRKDMTDREFELLTDFAYFLEKLFKVCEYSDRYYELLTTPE